MRRLKMAVPLGAASLVMAGPVAFPVAPAYADCEIVSATHGGNWLGEALSMAQALAAKSARDLKAKKGWRGITMKAQQVKPDPFWKTVRPQVSTNIIVGVVCDRAHLHHLLDRRHRALRLHLRLPGVRE